MERDDPEKGRFGWAESKDEGARTSAMTENAKI